MTSSSSGGRGLNFSVGRLSPSGDRLQPRPPEAVLEILVVADCRGRAARGVCEPLARRRAERMSIERLERAMQSWRARAPTSLLDAAGQPFWLEPESLDDFHPDRLLETAAPLAELAELRRSLDRDPAVASRLAALLGPRSVGSPLAGSERPPIGERDTAGSAAVPGGAGGAASRLTQAVSGAGARADESGSDLVARLLGGAAAQARDTAPPAAAPGAAALGGRAPGPLSASDGAPGQTAPGQAAPSRAAAKVDIDRFIRAIVGAAGGASSDGAASSDDASSAAVRSAAGSSAARPSRAELESLAAAADSELARRLRELLAAPAVRALEATWRGLDGLCRHNPDEARVRVSVLDASFDELAADPGAAAELIADAAPALLLIDHVFTGAPGPLRALAALLVACRERELTVLAGAHPHLAGCAHFEEVSQPEENAVELPEDARAAWAEVLGAREAGVRLGLALPRFLLRQPYGADGEPIERFPFEEILDPSDHEAFSWGNGAYLLARALGIEHTGERGVHADGSIEVRDLPVVYLASDSDSADSRIKPNAEAWVSQRSLGRLRAAGFSVLAGRRDTDRIRIYPSL